MLSRNPTRLFHQLFGGVDPRGEFQKNLPSDTPWFGIHAFIDQVALRLRGDSVRLVPNDRSQWCLTPSFRLEC